MSAGRDPDHAGNDSREVIEVAAGVLRDSRGWILLSQRPSGKHLAGLWEFPGGKCGPGEPPADALARELREELGVRVESARPVLCLRHAYPEIIVRLRLFEVERYSGRPAGLEGQSLCWVRPGELDSIDMPAADRPIIKALGTDPHYAITPDPVTFGGTEAVIEWCARCLGSGVQLIQLRAHSLDSRELAALAGRVGALARNAGARWVLNASSQAAMDLDADGVHLTSRALLTLSSRPLPDRQLVVASCHDEHELAHAGRIGADFVTLSPVHPTASHPQAEALGWSGFSALCRHSPLPVFALGGVGPGDLEKARECGGFGVAGISAFGAV